MNYKILHMQVGPWEEGRVVSEEAMKAHQKDIDISRLLTLKAIAPAQEAETDTPLPVGPQNPTNPGEGYKAPGEPTDDEKAEADKAAAEQEKLAPEARHTGPVPVRPTKKA